MSKQRNGTPPFFGQRQCSCLTPRFSVQASPTHPNTPPISTYSLGGKCHVPILPAAVGRPGLLATLWARTANADVQLTAEMMKIVLHTATPQEEGFIEYVLARVDKGTLPLDLVQSTFLWAKKKPYKKFFYFKQGLILRGSRNDRVQCRNANAVIE